MRPLSKLLRAVLLLFVSLQRKLQQFLGSVHTARTHWPSQNTGCVYCGQSVNSNGVGKNITRRCYFGTARERWLCW